MFSNGKIEFLSPNVILEPVYFQMQAPIKLAYCGDMLQGIDPLILSILFEIYGGIFL